MMMIYDDGIGVGGEVAVEDGVYSPREALRFRTVAGRIGGVAFLFILFFGWCHCCCHRSRPLSVVALRRGLVFGVNNDGFGAWPQQLLCSLPVYW